ncbi:MAG: hypothetical protein WBV26_14395 [Candidatus Sulfotelmatobacter sp.]
MALALMLICGLANSAYSVSKPHIVAFVSGTRFHGSPGGTAEEKPLALKVRPLLIDARIKEFTLGTAHDVTDRLFVIRRAFRVNDSLPQESASAPHWQWQRGGWLLVDRVTGHISPINLPEFDAFYSAASWYRDYAAYCGVAEDGKKVYAVVAQISRRKPVLKKLLEGESVTVPETKDASPDSACLTPAWQRAPIRVTFESTGAAKQTFVIHGHIVDLVTEEEDDEEAAK